MLYMYVHTCACFIIQSIYHFLGTVTFRRSLLLVECCMLNCLSTFPVSEMNQDNINLLVTLLYSHLETIPNLDRPQNMVCTYVYKYVCEEIVSYVAGNFNNI